MRGYLLGALAAASYGLNPLFTLPMYRAGMSVDSVLFYRYLTAVVMMGGMMLLRGRSLRIERGELPVLGAMGLLMSSSSLFLFQSYNHMDAGIASTILFVYPVLVALIMVVGFHERIPAVTAGAIALAFGGVALLCRGGEGSVVSLWGIVLVFLSSLSYAVYIVGVNRSRLKTMDVEKLTFYVLLVGWLMYVVRLRFCADLQFMPEAWLWGCGIGLGLFPTIISLVAMAGAIRRIGSTPTAILGALEPVTALCIGVAVFGEVFTARIMTGVLLILAGVSCIIAGDGLTARLEHLAGALHLRAIPLRLHPRRHSQRR